MVRDERPYNILVIEDNEGDFNLIVDFLNERIINPGLFRAVNYREAKTILLKADEQFDVILLDLTLPDKSGYDLVAGIINFEPSCPIIILTGYEDIEFSISSISQGVSDYLTKEDLNATTLYKSIVYSIERKKILSDLKESEQRYSDLFHLSPQPTLVFDPQTLQFLQVNQAATALYGYTSEEFLQMRLPDVKLEEDKLDINALDRMNDLHDGLFTNTYKHRKKSGELLEVEIFSAPLVVHGKTLRSVIINDITEKKHFELTLTKAIIKTQEDERYEIGGELHDNVCQILATSNMGFGMIRESIPPAVLPLFTQSQEAILLASKEIRRLSHRLAPAFYDSRTLKEEFCTLLQSFNLEDRYETELSFDASIDDNQLGMDIKLSMYRILQEQLRNIFKYAEGKRINVQVFKQEKKLRMMISDDGIGFDPASIHQGIGMANMRRRTALCSGEFELISSPGQGCSVKVEIPLPA